MAVSAENQVKIAFSQKMAKGLKVHEKIISLHKRGLSKTDIAKSLLESKSTIGDIKKHYKTTGNIEPTPISGRPRIVKTTNFLKNVKEKINRNSNRGIKKLAREYDVSFTSMHRLITVDLNMNSYKCRNVPFLAKNWLSIQYIVLIKSGVLLLRIRYSD